MVKIRFFDIMIVIFFERSGYDMTLTSTKSWKHYMLLCRTLERNDIQFIRNDKKLSVKCSIAGERRELNFLFVTDPEKMLMTLYSPVAAAKGNTDAGSAAMKICSINNTLSNGCFCIDEDDGIIYFRVVISFYETNLSPEIFEYMLSLAADTVEENYPLLCVL